MRKLLNVLWIMLPLLFVSANVIGQASDSTNIFDYADPQEYEIGGVKVSGAEFSDDNAIIAIAGFKVGDKIRVPGPETQRALKSLWKLSLFEDVQILKEKTLGDIIFFEIVVKERPRLSNHSFRGVKKSYHDDLNEKIDRFLVKGGIVTENIKTNASEAIEKYFREKGFLDASVITEEVPDDRISNSIRLVFIINRGKKVKIQNITFTGNDNVKDKKLRKQMENTNRKWKLFSPSRYVRTDYETDKNSIIKYYNTIGFRDAQIASDSIWREDDGDLRIHMNVHEGNRYFFREIKWKGNSVYDVATLENVLGIEKGEVYNQELLETRLRFSQDGRDVSSLYMDEGYLFFQVDPIEVAIEGDSIDLEIRIFEGPQATIDKVVIKGNDRTHEHVIRRELRTVPGEKFSRSDIIRSQREIVNLGYFNPENLGINTPVNPQRGTVDIEYTVEEKPSDQLELSAGWGGLGRGVIGTLGVAFNNFSLRNIDKPETWSPLPQGDGQRFSVRAQTNGRFFQSYNFSFTEPWLGGKKPNSFTVAGFYTLLTTGLNTNSDNYGQFDIAGLTVSLGSRLKWPDDNFVSSTSLNLQRIGLQNWFRALFITDDGDLVDNGEYYNFSINQTISRSTINDPLFPRNGSRISLSGQFTLPYSLFTNEDYSLKNTQDRFRFLEYHKWKFAAEWYNTIVGNLVLKVEAKIGMIGAYNNDIGISPFERFQLGGDGLNNQNLGLNVGTDIISLRGYEIEDLENNIRPEISANEAVPTPIYDKFTVELRYPISLNPNSTIYVLGFAQGGNAWQSFDDFNPFDVYRSVGMGLRVFLPMFGTLGFDYGLGFDKPGPRTFNNYGNFNIVLGFEPE
jgi:outer membrane protein insertion porin family